MTIGEVNFKYHISTDTLRYCEKIEFIENVTKIKGKREYTENDLKRIEFIICMKNIGFKLEDIITFLSLYKKRDSTIPERIRMLYEQKDALLKKIEEEKKTLEFLEHKIAFYKKEEK